MGAMADGMKKRKNFIQGALSKPGSKGALHRQLGVPQGQKIPASKMSAALAGKYGPQAKRRAQFARTLKGLNG